jgi:hypothetical protein
MFTFIVFIIFLGILLFLFTMKGIEIFYGRKMFTLKWFEASDIFLLKLIIKIRIWWGHLNLKNVILIFSLIVASIRKLIITLKRRFDHKQVHFFTKREHNITKNKGAVSFFLKDVSDYKKKLREESGNKQ